MSTVSNIIVIAHGPEYALFMKRLQAFKFELITNGEQHRKMSFFAGAYRYIYNKAFKLQIETYEEKKKRLSYFQLCKLLTNWRTNPETPWLLDAPSQPLQQSLKDLGRAYTNFFEGRAGFPRTKKKGRTVEKFRYPQGCKLEQHNSRIFLPKIGWVHYRNSREVLGVIKNVTVSRKKGKWHVSIQTEREVAKPVPTATTAIGIDVGIVRFATMDDGSYIAPLNSFKKHQKRLKFYQRRMSRKKKGSKNWKKAVAKVQKTHSTIANAREDYLHKITTTISKNHALVCIEDVKVRNMSRSSKGNSEQHGKNVKQKSGLNRCILDQGWGEFRRQLEYKMEWNGGILIAVPPQYTSQTCPRCNHVSKDNRKKQAKFLCVKCTYENHADAVGAINVLERGYRLLACGETVPEAVLRSRNPPKRLKQKCLSAVGISVL